VKNTVAPTTAATKSPAIPMATNAGRQWSIGGSDHWYYVPNHRVRAWNSDRTTWAVQASALRTVSNSYNMFVVESFMDEVAHALGRDPLEFRLSMLTGKGGNRGIPNTGYPPGTPSDYYMDQLWISLPWPQEKTWPLYESATVGGALRLANCLRVAAGKCGYGSRKLPPNTGVGFAVSSAEERQSPTWVAGAAEVTVDPGTGNIKVNRPAVVDVCDRLPQRTRAGIARIDYRDGTGHRSPAQGATTQEGGGDY